MKEVEENGHQDLKRIYRVHQHQHRFFLFLFFLSFKFVPLDPADGHGSDWRKHLFHSLILAVNLRVDSHVIPPSLVLKKIAVFIL